MTRDDAHQLRALSDEQWERLSGQQHALQASIERISSWAHQHPHVFAGLWADNSGFLTGIGPVRLAVALAGLDLAEGKAGLAPLMDDPELLVLVAQTWPEAVLRQAQNNIATRFMGVPQGATLVSSVGVDVPANLLEVMLNQPDPELEERIRGQVRPVPVRIVYGYVSHGGGNRLPAPPRGRPDPDSGQYQ